MYTKLYSARSSYNTPWELFVFEPLSFRFFDLRYTIRVVSRAITLGFYHVILMHGGICEHGRYMLTFSALCEYFDAGKSRCVVCWGVTNNLRGCGDSAVHRGCVLALLRIVKLCIKLMFLHACVINFCSFLLFSMLKFPVINITVIFYIC